MRFSHSDNVYDGFTDFCDDAEKMHDFLTLSMEDFLKSYSYLDVRDYYATYDRLMFFSQQCGKEN